jgi:hypothetical protein
MRALLLLLLLPHAELLLRKPWLPGMTDIDQLGKIFQALGTPNNDNWPGEHQVPGLKGAVRAIAESAQDWCAV